jgi:hypothetical protein
MIARPQHENAVLGNCRTQYTGVPFTQLAGL